MKTETKHDIYEIAEQFDRLCPSQVDDTERDHGHGRESGHIGHEQDAADIVGWYCDAGNVGYPVASIPHSRIDALYDRLSSLDDGSLDRGGIDAIVRECGGEC